MWCVLALFVGLALLAASLSTDAGRRKLADVLEHFISSQIPGTITIGRLERLGMLDPVLHDLRFKHPDGSTVLKLDRAEVDIDVSDLLRGQLTFHRARTSGGEIELSTQPDGRLTLEAALDWPTPGSGDPKDGFHYRLQSMHVQGLTVVTRVAKNEFLRLRDTQGFVAVVRETTPGVNVQLERIEGTLDRELLGAVVRVVQVDGEIHGKQQRIADMRAKLRIGDDQRWNAHLRVFDRPKMPVELTLETGGGIQSELAALGLKLGSWFTDSVRVDWK
jgi:hypothetical protein